MNNLERQPGHGNVTPNGTPDPGRSSGRSAVRSGTFNKRIARLKPKRDRVPLWLEMLGGRK